MTEPSKRITQREMTAADLDQVLETEFISYKYPWSRGIFQDCLNSGYDCRVLLMAERIVGHSIMSSAAGEAHLLNVCVRRDVQGQGLGRFMVRQVLRRAEILGAEHLFLEVRPSNRVAVALYRSLGFRSIGTRKDYYPAETGREDAEVFALALKEISERSS